jgi:DNA-binding MarR family transcriptional regulator
MISTLEQLSELQQKILKHFFECSSEKETVSHISKQINALQPAVFRSVSSLIRDKYVIKKGGKDNTGGAEKVLSLTEKGAAAAALLGVSAEQLQNYVKKYKPQYPRLQELLLYFKTEPSKQDSLIKNAMNYYIKNDILDHDIHDMRQQMEDQYRTTKIIHARINAILEAATRSNIVLENRKTLREFVDKYGLDKNSLINTLEQKKQQIESLIEDLTETSKNIAYRER